MVDSAALKRTPFYSLHKQCGGRLVSFAGWEMPVYYTGIMDEHLTVRSKVGVFDVSHMGEFEVWGPNREKFVNYVTTNNVTRLQVGQVQYSAFCNEKGGIVDDTTVYKFEDHYLFVVNAANEEKDFNWLSLNLIKGVELRNVSNDVALLAVQGPTSQQALAGLTDLDLDEVNYYWFNQIKIMDVEMVVSRTGYTGEDGFELYFSPQFADKIWIAILEAGKNFGIKPIGLGARDTLRLEMKYALYGNDIDDTTTPLEAGLGWITKLKKGEFIGRDVLLKQKEEGIRRKLIGFKLTERGIPRPHYPILVNGKKISEVASGTSSPSLGVGIGTAYLPVEHTSVGTELGIEIRGKVVKAKVMETPFYKDGSRR